MSTPTTAPNTGTILLLSLPTKSHVGIDLSSFTSTATFSGLKLLPPGLHHLWISPYPSLTLRSSFWLHCTFGSTQTLRYDAETESLHDAPADAPPITPELWTHSLTAYRQRDPSSNTETPSPAAWELLTAHVTPDLLTALLGPLWCCSTTTTSSAPDAEDDDDASHLPGTHTPEDTPRLAFTPIDLKRTWPATAVGRERTEMARDRSWALGDVRRRQPCGLLGEFEVAFVACYFLGNFVAARQWRAVVALVLTCRTAAVEKEHKEFFVGFVQVLRRQLEVLDGGDEGGFLGQEAMDEVLRLLRGFVKMLREEEEDGNGGREVGEAVAELGRWAEKRLDWVLDTREVLRRGMVMTEEGDMVEIEDEGLEEEEERGEYAPAVFEEEANTRRSESPPLVIQLADEDDDDPRY